MKRLVLCIISILVPSLSQAEVLYGVTITKVYAQSRLDSDAYLVQINQTLPAVCNSNRLYINMDDKELFSSALANYIAGKNVDIIYNTTSSPKNVAGHLSGLTCRLISIF